MAFPPFGHDQRTDSLRWRAFPARFISGETRLSFHSLIHNTFTERLRYPVTANSDDVAHRGGAGARPSVAALVERRIPLVRRSTPPIRTHRRQHVEGAGAARGRAGVRVATQSKRAGVRPALFVLKRCRPGSCEPVFGVSTVLSCDLAPDHPRRARDPPLASPSPATVDWWPGPSPHLAHGAGAARRFASCWRSLRRMATGSFTG
jgi:hypothetical protein